MISISTALTLFFILLFIVGIALHALIVPDLQDYKNIKESLEKKSKINLTYNGGTSLYFPPDWDKEKDGGSFNYLLKSWDGGKIWYAVEYDKECEGGMWGVKILGRADELYPGLLEHIEGCSGLIQHVQEHGPIDNDSTVRLLKEAGFTVTKTYEDGK